jgi:hypothetical protein
MASLVEAAAPVAATRKGALYGGAATCTLPKEWVDMASLGQPPPDNQEVFCEPRGGAGQSLIFEVAERADVGDDEAAAFFFADVAECGGATSSRLVAAGSAPPLRSGAGAVRVALGHMVLPKTGCVGGAHGVDVGLAVFRFAADGADVVATLNVPALAGSRVPAGASPAALLAAGGAGMGPLRDVVASLVVDRSLFASS